MCSHKPPHSISSSKLGQETFTAQFSTGRHGAARPTWSSVQRTGKEGGHQICTQPMRGFLRPKASSQGVAHLLT